MTSIRKGIKLAAKTHTQRMTLAASERVRQITSLRRPVRVIRFASSDTSQLRNASAEQVDAVLRNSNVMISLKS